MSKTSVETKHADKSRQLKQSIEQLKKELREKKEYIQAQETRLMAYHDSSIDAMVQINFDGIVTGWNRQAENIFGWPAADAIGMTLEKTIIPERYRQSHTNGLANFLKSGTATVLNSLIEVHALHRDGHEFPVELSISLIETGEIQEFNAYIRDISERKQAETVIWNQANFDSLTSLPNRNLFLHQLDKEIGACDRSNLSLALLYVDLDRFKEVNDTLGHDMGDLLLIEISSRLKKGIREIDTVSRLSGDEFTIILGNIDDQLSVQRICQDLLDSLSKPFQLDTERVYLTASIGATFYPQDATETDLLQRNADQAMYAAKNAGRNRMHFFTPELQERALRKRKMITDLRQALQQQQQFEVYYQPIVEIETGKLCKAEALLRWHHPEAGIISPAIFIPIAEETGMITTIGDWVFRQAVDKVQQWREKYSQDFQISINTSPLQWIEETSTMSKWFGHLTDLGLSGQAITIEITEGLLMDAGDTITNRLLDFRDNQIQVSIDDFGTGYSSLSYLNQFDIDYLKIDQSFVRNLGRDENDLALCEAIIVMAHKLGIKVIAEGVETDFQKQTLEAFNCDYAQGFLYSKPVPAGEFEILLTEY